MNFRTLTFQQHATSRNMLAKPSCAHARNIGCRASSSNWNRDGAVQLPGAVWLKENFDPISQFLVQGDNFVMHRVNTPLLSFATAPETCQIVLREKEDTGLIPLPPQEGFDMLLPFSNTHTVEVDSTGVNISLPMLRDLPTTSLAVISKEEALAVVMSASTGSSTAEQEQTQDVVFETNNTNSPRRTQKIKFTCRVCGATSIKPINPHAWTRGTVFAKCGNCNITHKLVDNLKLFHELSGPIFTPTTPSLNMPSSLQLTSDAKHRDDPVDSLWLLSINPEIGFDL